MQKSDNLSTPSSTPLDAKTIDFVCREQGYEVEVIVLSEVESTNSWLFENKSDAPIMLCAAEQQTVGRGRRGKTWHSPESGVTFSIRFNRPEAVTEFAGLSLLVGACLCDQLRQVGASDAMVKWPNDVLVNGAKLSGILIETSVSAAADSATTVVIGIGINYRRGGEVALIDQSSTDLYEICGTHLPDRSELIANVASRVIASVIDGVPQALQSLAGQWGRYDALAGSEVTVDAGSRKVAGRVQGIDQSGRLKVETDDGLQAFSSADISVRAR